MNEGNSVYEKLGHAEVVQLELTKNAAAEFGTFADAYFKQFVKTPFGMMRSVRPITRVEHQFMSAS